MNTVQWINKLGICLLLALALNGALPSASMADETTVATTTASVNVNTADAQTIAASIKGIGLSRAEAIVAYREQHGPFKSVDDLANVKGVGAKTVDNNRKHIKL